MFAKSRISFAVLFALALALAIFVGPAASGLPQAPADEAVPAFHAEPPTAPLPATLEPTLFANALSQNAYAFAARVKKLLYQQPCYCRCDRSQGHGSLLDCFAGKHASVCDVCIREGLYTYEQSRKGKSAAQIRTGIESGEWKQLDLSKYQTPFPAK
jgi:Protein of unknown function with PCYCGC motif